MTFHNFQIINTPRLTKNLYFPNEFRPISVHFEDAGTSLDDVGPPNYDPRNNGYWEEFLVDFGIREDPYSDYEED